MQTLLQDLRFAVRTLLRSRSFTLTVMATLALGIGLNAAIFTVVDCVLLRPLGYRDADRIVALRTRFTDENRSITRLGGDDYNDVARQVHGFQATAYYQAWPDGIELNGVPLYLPVAWVGPHFGEVLGIQPLAGRLFHGSDMDGREALVGASFAREHFGSAPAALGKVIRYSNGLHTIVGVLPDGFSFPDAVQVWIEGGAEPRTANRTSYSQQAVGRRRAGVTPEQLAAELSTFSAQLQRAYIEDAHKAIETIPLQEQVVGTIRPTLRLLMGSVAIILLIVVANITHLQLIRATRQLRAVTIRTALGASRTALASRALMEAGVLAVAGTLAAVLIAVPALQLLVRLAPPEIPRLSEIHLNADVFLFSFALSLLVMALTAVLPVWRSWHVDPAAALRQDAARGTESRGATRLRDGLIVAEVALTLTLSVMAILLTRQLIAQSREDLGFAAESLVVLDTHVLGSPSFIDPPKNPSPRDLAANYAANLPIAQSRLTRLNTIRTDLKRLPGVISADAILGAPMGFSGSDVGYAVKGRQVFAPPYSHLQSAEIRPVTPNFFTTMGIPLLRGRSLGENDRLGSPSVLLINQSLARTIFPNEDPVGKQIMCGYDDTLSWWTIAGVVGDIHNDSPAATPSPTMYVPVAQHPGIANDMQLVVRTAMPTAAMAETLRRSLLAAHPEVAVKATTMRENIGETQRGDHFRSLLFASFAGVSILLAAVGMYGVTAYSVTQRRFEFGVRFALGANRAQVLGMVLRRALSVALLGIVAGVGLSLAGVRLLAGVVGKMPGIDLVAYLLAIGTVLLIALCATLLPARRASTIDPMSILRSE